MRLFDSMKAEEYYLTVEVYNTIIAASNQPKYLNYALELLHRMKVQKSTINNKYHYTFILNI